MDDIQRYNFWHLEIQDFSSNLWTLVRTARNEENGLVSLYMGLNRKLKDPIKCNDFLWYVMFKNLTTDELVHILNALSPIKDTLYHWNEFVIKAKLAFIKEGGEKLANDLLKVIR